MSEEKKKEQYEIIDTYEKAWKYEKKIYSISTVKLPFPINMSKAGYFGLGLALMWLLSRIPVFAMIPGVMRYIIFPAGIVMFLTKITFDGKGPLAWLAGFFNFAREPKEMARFRPCVDYGEGYFTNVKKER